MFSIILFSLLYDPKKNYLFNNSSTFVNIPFYLLRKIAKCLEESIEIGFSMVLYLIEQKEKHIYINNNTSGNRVR